jgi:hypothetical protein
MEAEGWVADGLVTAEQVDALLARYADASSPGGEARSVSVITSALYATAGILIGASSVALVYVEHEWRHSTGSLLGAAVLLAVTAAVLRSSRPRAWLLADAGFVGALVPLSFAPLVQDQQLAASVAALVLPVALVVWRRGSPFVVPLGVIAASIGGGCAANAWFPHAARSAYAAWAVLQLALVVGVVVLDRSLKKRESTTAGALAVVAAAISLLVYLLDANILDGGSRAVETELGLAMLAMTIAGGVVRHRGVVIGAGAVLGMDAIAFAFDVGGILTGTIALAATAGLLVWQAEFLRRYFRENQ